MLMLSSHLHLGHSSGLFPSSFPTKILYTPLLSSISATCPTSHSSRFDHPNNTGWDIQKLLIMWFSPIPCYLVPPRSKYSPQQLILKHPQPTFLLECERPSFTTVQKQPLEFSQCQFAITFPYTSMLCNFVAALLNNLRVKLITLPGNYNKK